MRDLFLAIVAICLVGISVIVLKPSDQACRAAITERLVDGSPFGSLLATVAINDYTITITDHVFYKEIYTITGDRVGTAFCTQVILDK